MIKIPLKSEIHSIYGLSTDGWTPTLMRAWLKKHKLKAIKPVHKMGTQLRYRIKDPKLFKRFTTKKIGNIYLVIGWKKSSV